MTHALVSLLIFIFTFIFARTIRFSLGDTSADAFDGTMIAIKVHNIQTAVEVFHLRKLIHGSQAFITLYKSGLTTHVVNTLRSDLR